MEGQWSVAYVFADKRQRECEGVDEVVETVGMLSPGKLLKVILYTSQ